MTGPWMEIIRIDLSGGLPEQVTVRMSINVARRLQRDWVGSLLYGDFRVAGEVTVVWPIQAVARGARLFGAMPCPDETARVVRDCLAGLCLRWWPDLDTAQAEVETAWPTTVR